jgi:methionyl-tRNA formyltransferase
MGLHVACTHSALCLTEVQLEGKKRMHAADFARGYRVEVGKVLGTSQGVRCKV